MKSTGKPITTDNAEAIAGAVAAFVDARLEAMADSFNTMIKSKVQSVLEQYNSPIILTSENTASAWNNPHLDPLFSTLDIDAKAMGAGHAWDFTSIPPEAWYRPGDQNTNQLMDFGVYAFRPFLFVSNLGNTVLLTPMSIDDSTGWVNFTPFSDNYGNLVTGSASPLGDDGVMIIEFWFIERTLTQVEYDAIPTSKRDSRTTYNIVGE